MATFETLNVSANKTIPSSFNPPSNKKSKYIGDYKLGRTLGSGSMGKVKLAINTITGQKYAVKIISYNDPETDINKKDLSRKKRIEREISLLKIINHPYIVKLFDVVITDEYYYLFFEFVEGGQLLDFIISHGRLNENKARLLMRQIISGVEYCHRNSICHRDLKIENILVDNCGNIKIIDFGLSNLYSSKSQLDTFCGSLYFAAPELLSAQNYVGPEVDIWSLGVIFYVLICGRVPFDDSNMPALHAKIKKGLVVYPQWLTKECKYLISRMLVTNPSNRATMDEIIKNTFINKGCDEMINIYLPSRDRIKLPLNKEAILNMDGFHFGTPNEIENNLIKIISNVSYAKLPNLSDNMNLESNTIKIKDLRKFMFKNKKEIQTESIYPLICIYYLVMEKMDRERLLGISDISSNDNNLGLSSPKLASDKSDNDLPKTPKLKFDTNNKSKRSSVKASLVTKFSRTALKKPTLFHRWSMINDNSIADENTNEAKIKRRWSRMVFPTKNSNSSVETNNKEVSNENIKNNVNKIPVENINKVNVGIKWSSVSLKGLFSTSTTSTKKPHVIEHDLINVLDRLSIKYEIVNGLIECTIRNPNSPSTRELDSNLENKPVVMFHIQLVKIKLLKVYGVQFRRLQGGPWEYKSVCSLILSKLRL